MLALLATALAVRYREDLTGRTIRFDPSDQGAGFYSYSYNDSGNGGHSKVAELRPLNWTCSLPSARIPSPYCGFGMDLDVRKDGKGLPLSRFDKIKLNIDYEGPGEVLHVSLSDRRQNASSKDAVVPPKVNQATMRLRPGEQVRALEMGDFLIPQWWLDLHKVPKAESAPSFDNVIAIELIISGTAGFHRLRVKGVEIHTQRVSLEAWYGGIAVCWMLIIGALLIQRQRQVEQWKRQLADRILNSVPQVIFSIGPDGWPDFVSKQWSEHYGGDPSQLLGRGWLKVIHPDDRRSALRGWVHAYASGEPYEAEFRVRLADGSYRWAEARARPDKDVQGKVSRWFGTWTESHERVLAEQALKSSERLYRSILEASIDCVAVLSPDGVVELVNGPGVDATELDSAAEIQGKHFLRLWQRKSEQLVTAAITKARSGEVARFQSFCPTAKGTPKWWDVVLTPMLDETGGVSGILAISRDISAEREKSEQLRWASEHDPLTLLPNRRAFQARLQSATLRAMQTGDQVGLLLIDLDHFKHVNDSLGHIAGDVVLQAVAERLKDSLGPNDFVARVGGDEFAIILGQVRDCDDMLAFSDVMFARLRTPLRLAGRAFSASASIGGAIFPQDADSANDLFKTADTALYALKDAGRGGTQMFHPHMLEQVENAASQLGLARHALSERTVVPAYQSKVDVQSNRIVGFEALLRWNHPTNGLQLPATVEEAFKDYELAAKIGELMQNNVARDIRSWMERGLEFGRISINASPAEFLRDDYAERLLAVLEAHGVPGSAIEVEVTEHALLDHGPHFVARALAALKQAGISVSLDDFGTGYSSLSHLRDFPVDLVKIDKSFVQQMTHDPEIASIVAAVINLARSIEIEVVAEGVETAGQLELLRAMGCGLAQGHLFSRPVEEIEVVKLLGKIRAAA